MHGFSCQIGQRFNGEMVHGALHDLWTPVPSSYKINELGYVLSLDPVVERYQCLAGEV